MNPIVCAIWGEEGSGKSSVGLSFPKPLRHYDLDVGGFARAAWRITPDELKLILSRPYPIPIPVEKLMGVQGKGASIRFPRKEIGYKEVWQKLITDFVADCMNPEIKTLQMDSATQLWAICHKSLLQEKQEIQIAGGMKDSDPRFREKLLPVEFPNDRMKSLIFSARSYGKNLVLTHYPKNVYKQKFDNKGELVSYESDELDLDGFKETSRLADIVIYTYKEEVKEKGQVRIIPRAKITTKCGIPGLGMTAVGLELPEPSYKGLLDLQSAMQGE